MLRKINQIIPSVNTPHECMMCGQMTTWEERQKQAERMKIHGYSIRQLKEIVEFAISRGYK